MCVLLPFPEDKYDWNSQQKLSQRTCSGAHRLSGKLQGNRAHECRDRARREGVGLLVIEKDAVLMFNKELQSQKSDTWGSSL